MVRQAFYIISSLLLIAIASIYFIWAPILWSLLIVGPLILVGLIDVSQKKHSIKRNYPIIGHGRFLLEALRPEIMQYFVETDTEGRPFNRIYRSLVYQRAKKINDTTPFGTQVDVYRTGYEWMDHSLHAFTPNDSHKDPRVLIGGDACTQPYSASILNISAMSFGALSNHAIESLNGGAKIGNFAHNTGEGSISPYHLKPGGDLIWQIGTGYFGCRTKEGNFSEEKFEQQAKKDNVKMIEIKLSQGAKPGHGGILPAIKNSDEIALIRGVEPHTDVISPPTHTVFTNANEMMQFISLLRKLSGGKPIGFKLCVGRKDEFIELCETMLSSNIKPDFITVDGGEGGTGAAPVEFSNSLGMPLRDGLTFVVDTLKGYNLKKDIKVIASGKLLAGFHIVRALAMGADLCYSARAMMMSLGCIQALECNHNTCPVGVATQDARLTKGLVVESKTIRVANFHRQTVHAVVELLAAAGIKKPSEIKRSIINRRTTMNKVMRYDEIYPEVVSGCLIK